MFSLREFIKSGYLKAVGNRPDYWVILNAAGYMDKGVLTEGDLEEIQAAINSRNAPAAPEIAEASGDKSETPYE